MPLTRLIYFSECQLEAHTGSVIRILHDILTTSDRNNRIHGLTGFLVFDDRWFVQVLEGERDNVWRIFDRIRMDDRHRDPVIVEVADIERQSFAGWRMRAAVRQPMTEHLFRSFLTRGVFDPRRLSAGQMLSMMAGLARAIGANAPATMGANAPAGRKPEPNGAAPIVFGAHTGSGLAPDGTFLGP